MQKQLTVVFCVIVLALSVGIAQSSQQTKGKTQHQDNSEPQVVHDGNSPAYHTQAPKPPLPDTLPPQQFSDPRVRAAYAMAAKIKPVLYQQPCYCHCDVAFGHRSLLDCYTGDHGAECLVCIKEGIFTYEQTQQGKTPGQIRAAIKRGEYANVDINRYLNAGY
jgi:hypothetical protein